MRIRNIAISLLIAISIIISPVSAMASYPSSPCAKANTYISYGYASNGTRVLNWYSWDYGHTDRYGNPSKINKPKTVQAQYSGPRATTPYEIVSWSFISGLTQLNAEGQSSADAAPQQLAESTREYKVDTRGGTKRIKSVRVCLNDPNLPSRPVIQ